MKSPELHVPDSDQFSNKNLIRDTEFASESSTIGWQPMSKIALLDAEGNAHQYDYGNVYFRQPCGDAERLVIGPTGRQVELIDTLASTFPTERFYILYVLLMSHAGRSPGRYQSPIIESHEQLAQFIRRFQNFFEGDARHQIWIASPDSRSLLVYDQHDIIFAYGQLDRFAAQLDRAGYRRAEFWFPTPHSHRYDPANVNEEDELMGYFDWQYFDLQPGDDWP